MTMRVRFCLSYDRFKLHFIAFKVDIISIETQGCRGRRYDVTCTRQNVMLKCDYTIFMT